jgi:N-acetylglucosamine-6-sulfatase
VDGRSLLPLIEDPDLASGRRQAALLDLWPGSGRGEDVTRVPSFHGVRTNRHLYVEYKTGERELYDLAVDPNQLENRAGDADAGLIAALAARVAQLRECAGLTCRAFEDLPVPEGGVSTEPPKKPADVLD